MAELVTTAEFAEKLGVAEGTVRHWVRTGRVSPERVGSRLMFGAVQLAQAVKSADGSLPPLSAKQFANRLQVTRHTLYGWIAKGLVTPVRVGAQYRFGREQFAEIITGGPAEGAREGV